MQEKKTWKKQTFKSKNFRYGYFILKNKKPSVQSDDLPKSLKIILDFFFRLFVLDFSLDFFLTFFRLYIYYFRFFLDFLSSL